MALRIPPTLQLIQLKALASKCGIATSGTKAVLLQRLGSEISPVELRDDGHKSNAKSPCRILSIDMGIRNLAYCILDVPPTSPKALLAAEDGPSKLPKVIAWQRLAVSTKNKIPDIGTPSLSETETVVESSEKDNFEPPALAAAAYKLVKKLVEWNPTHVLIERQRFRSMGSPHILEWTVRVNMFESMLYAVLQTFEKEGQWQGVVLPITPGKVGPFWVGDGVAEGEGEENSKGKKRNTKSAKLRNKGAKIDLVKSWLEEGKQLRISNEVRGTVTAYLEKWHRLPGKKKGLVVKRELKEEKGEDMPKLDDLADCLLQGMAWIQWEENKRLVLNDGVEAIIGEVPISRKTKANRKKS